MSKPLSRRPRSSERRRLSLLLASLLGSCAMLLGLASSASAITFGMMWTGNYGQSVAEMEQVQRSGANVFRVPIDQGSSTVISDTEAIFLSAWQHGITIEPILIRSNGAGTQFPTSAEYPNWNTWVGQVVAMYGVNGSFWAGKANPKPVINWEVWNEPNLAANNPGGTTVQPENYGRFLVSTAGAIRKVQPSATILFGGLYMPGGMNYNTFLESADNVAGEPGSYSAVGIHPYAFIGKVGEMAAEIESVRSALDKKVVGAAGRPLVINELGWHVAKGDASRPAVSEAEQASLLTSSFNWIKANAAAKNIPTVYWYNLRDINAPGWSYACGLRKENGEYRPSWWAYQAQTGAPEWPVPVWNTENLGGDIPSDPDISSWGPGRVDIFVRGSDNSLVHKSWDAGLGWSVWERIGIGPALTSGPSAVSWGPGRIDVVARVTGNTVGHWGWESGVWGYEDLGGNITADPDIASWSGGRLDVFARGTDNGLFHKSWDPTYKWVGWEKIPGPTITSGPGAVSWGPGRIDVVARVAGNSIQHWGWENGIWANESIGGNSPSDPDISSWGGGRLDVFARGTNDRLAHQSWDPFYKWSGWEQILTGPTINSGPGAVSWGKNRIDVVARTTGSTVQHWSWEGFK